MHHNAYLDHKQNARLRTPLFHCHSRVRFPPSTTARTNITDTSFAHMDGPHSCSGPPYVRALPLPIRQRRYRRYRPIRLVLRKTSLSRLLLRSICLRPIRLLSRSLPRITTLHDHYGSICRLRSAVRLGRGGLFILFGDRRAVLLEHFLELRSSNRFRAGYEMISKALDTC